MNWLARLRQMGVTAETPASQARRIVLTNTIVLFVLGIDGVFWTTDLMAGLWSAFVFDIAAFVFFCLPLVMNHFGQTLLSRWTLMLVATLDPMLATYVFGPEIHFQLFYFPAACVPVLLFDVENRRAIVGASLLPIAGYALTTYWVGPNSIHAVSFPVGPVVWILQEALIFSLLIWEVYSLALVNQRSEESLRNAFVELNLKRQYEIRASRMSALLGMAGGMAHEINNPLATLSLSADMVRRDKSDPAAVLLHVDRMDRANDRIARIVSGLLSFARRAPRGGIARFTLGQVIDAAATQARERFARTGAGFELQAAAEVLGRTVDGEFDHLVAVIHHLLTNAADAVAESSSRRVILRADVDGASSRFVVRVCDTGPGVPADLREQIFEPFFTTKPVGSGTGLGLSLSTGIAHSHGGDLSLEPPGTLTTFKLTLPLGASTRPVSS